MLNPYKDIWYDLLLYCILYIIFTPCTRSFIAFSYPKIMLSDLVFIFTQCCPISSWVLSDLVISAIFMAHLWEIGRIYITGIWSKDKHMYGQCMGAP